jgi:hypothetical protein
LWSSYRHTIFLVLLGEFDGEVVVLALTLPFFESDVTHFDVEKITAVRPIGFFVPVGRGRSRLCLRRREL